MKNISDFKEKFSDYFEGFIRKYEGLGVLEKVLRELKWTEGTKLLQDYLKSLKDLPVKRNRTNSNCEVCNSNTGQQLLCGVCNESSIHKKKCAGIKSNSWTCKKCLGKETSERNDLNKAYELPILKRNGSSSIIEMSIAQNIEKILQESSSDKILNNIILQRQKEFAEIKIEFQKRNDLLTLIQKPEEIRRKRYQNDEFLRTNTENLINDLIDQLHCAHISGFETLKKLQKIYENDTHMLEKYRVNQREIVAGLLSADLPSVKIDNPQKVRLTKFEQFMEKNNPNGIFGKIEKTMEKFRTLKIEEGPVLTHNVLYGIVKVIIDGTLANCEYTQAQQIDHVGGGTNPELLKSALKKIKEKYKIK